EHEEQEGAEKECECEKRRHSANAPCDDRLNDGHRGVTGVRRGLPLAEEQEPNDKHTKADHNPCRRLRIPDGVFDRVEKIRNSSRETAREPTIFAERLRNQHRRDSSNSLSRREGVAVRLLRTWARMLVRIRSAAGSFTHLPGIARTPTR